MKLSANFGDTFTEFINNLQHLTGWQTKNGYIARYTNELQECPLTAVANQKVKEKFTVADYIWAGANLGFNSTEATLISIAADDGTYSGLEKELEMVRDTLLKVTKCKFKNI